VGNEVNQALAPLRMIDSIRAANGHLCVLCADGEYRRQHFYDPNKPNQDTLCQE
jgi:hypothetical protein